MAGQTSEGRVESAGVGMQPDEKNLKQEQNSSMNQQFRGAAIHIKEDGTFAVELVGITPMELYGALDLVIARVRKQLGGGGQ